eukprot:Blabericola_migrator_1__11232@NODE_65_length_15685_cov_31_404533_g58_i0_p6_GENE_NODE_65_length_15685_cov_31_404533_g58_i0NODE_65_length_15685_cov_31_404533_g58_i0_p6_ORF_typecomplete_len474_score54_08PDEase_I/PF00233_19/3_8e65_NODE_65_length_15685_cov_31_404533_g58_i011282549
MPATAPPWLTCSLAWSERWITHPFLERSLTPLELASAILACVAHDVGHPGRNNAFHIQAESAIALLYNNISVLEKYHSFLCFRLAHCGREVNIFGNLSNSEYLIARRQIIGIILCTDMAEHFLTISKYRIRRNASDFDPRRNPEDTSTTIKLCAKLADLSHTLVKWDLHLQWSYRVVEEFYQQGEDEKALGLPISPLCNRATHNEFAKSQQGFIQFVVQPLMNELVEVAQDRQLYEKFAAPLIANKSEWEVLKESANSDKAKQLEVPETIRNISLAPADYPQRLFTLASRAWTVRDMNADAFNDSNSTYNLGSLSDSTEAPIAANSLTPGQIAPMKTLSFTPRFQMGSNGTAKLGARIQSTDLTIRRRNDLGGSNTPNTPQSAPANIPFFRHLSNPDDSSPIRKPVAPHRRRVISPKARSSRASRDDSPFIPLPLRGKPRNGVIKPRVWRTSVLVPTDLSDQSPRDDSPSTSG